MPKRRRRYYAYSDSEIERANERRRNRVPFRKIVAESRIPPPILFMKLRTTIPFFAKIDLKPLLSAEEENRLKNWILGKARLGFPMYSDEVKVAVKKILDEAGRKSPFIDNKPGSNWLGLFLKRHPEINEEQTKLFLKSNTIVTKENLRQWFIEVKSYLEENNLISVLERSGSIFNGDETTIQFRPKSGHLLGPRENTNYYEILSDKETVTVLCTFSAAGASLPPVIMFPYEQIPGFLTKSVSADWSIARSESAWMVSNIFYEYITSVFYPWCVKQKVQFPVIYFLDGHKARLSLELNDFCKEHNIILVSLFPNSTHITQPCDIAIFRPMKYNWSEAVILYNQKTNVSTVKDTFVPLFKDDFDRLSVDTIKDEFRKCGLYPFNPDAVDYNWISTRQQSNIEEPTVWLESSDLISTKKFFDCIIDKEIIGQFITMRNNNERCNDGVYLLWKTCMDNVELVEES